jgi:hypothetical protein
MSFINGTKPQITDGEMGPYEDGKTYPFEPKNYAVYTALHKLQR